MAYIRYVKCRRCGKEDRSHNGIYCTDCIPIINKQKKERWLEDFRGSKTLEQRIEQIEEWIYENENKIHSHAKY
jgi:hypothetical protein